MDWSSQPYGLVRQLESRNPRSLQLTSPHSPRGSKTERCEEALLRNQQKHHYRPHDLHQIHRNSLQKGLRRPMKLSAFPAARDHGYSISTTLNGAQERGPRYQTCPTDNVPALSRVASRSSGRSPLHRAKESRTFCRREIPLNCEAGHSVPHCWSERVAQVL